MRNGVAAFYASIPDAPDLVLNLPSRVVYDFVLGKGSIRQALAEGIGTSEGDVDALDQFASYFDFSKTDINLSSR